MAATSLSDINAVATKRLLPTIADTVFKQSPILNYLRAVDVWVGTTERPGYANVTFPHFPTVSYLDRRIRSILKKRPNRVCVYAQDSAFLSHFKFRWDTLYPKWAAKHRKRIHVDWEEGAPVAQYSFTASTCVVRSPRLNRVLTNITSP